MSDWGFSTGANKAPSSWLDRWLLFIVFVAGAIGIVFLKSLGAPTDGAPANDPSSQRGSWGVLATAWAISVMFAYAGIVAKTRKFRLREDMSGDNIYYLGFLFTLVSLAVSLWQFESAANVGAIINAFGIGVASTIVGLILRMVFNQMREDPVEIEQEVRMDLAQAAQSVRATLYDVSQKMHEFGISVQLKLEEMVRRVETDTRAAVETTTKELEVGKEALKTELSDMQGQAKRFSKSAGAVVESLETHASHLGAIAQVSEGLKGQVETLGGLASELERALRTRVENDTATANERIDLAGLAARASNGLVDLDSVISRMKKALVTATEAFERSGAGVESLTGAAKAHAEAMAAELEKSRGFTSQLHSGLVAVADELAKRAAGRTATGAPTDPQLAGLITDVGADTYLVSEKAVSGWGAVNAVPLPPTGGATQP